jgi:hypothetical protein
MHLDIFFYQCLHSWDINIVFADINVIYLAALVRNPCHWKGWI